MNSWSMRSSGVGIASAVPSRANLGERAPDVIPDDQPGILDRIPTAQSGTLNESLFFVGLEFDLDHHGPSP